MTTSRREFLAFAGALPLIGAVDPHLLQPRTAPAIDPTRFEPWIEVEAAALRSNVEVLSRLAGSRPIIAMIKNNGYGLGLREVARVLEPDPRVVAFGVVKVDEVISMRQAGIRNPIHLLALFGDAEGEDVVASQRHALCLHSRRARAHCSRGRTRTPNGTRTALHRYRDEPHGSAESCGTSVWRLPCRRRPREVDRHVARRVLAACARATQSSRWARTPASRLVTS